MEWTFILQVIELMGLIVLGLPTLYILFFAISGHFFKQKMYDASVPLQKIAVFIPGYKEDEVIVEAAKQALEQSYPADKYEVIVIADSFQDSTLMELSKLPLQTIQVQFESSTKAKALNAAMEVLDESYDIALILDADNLMDPHFLSKINAAFTEEVSAVQGHRTAKNLNTNLAVLDAISEEINNHIFRKGHRAVKLSSAIIGSGMAFRYPLFKTVMKDIHAIGGFDKELELRLLKDKHLIEYLDDALVYDEKVQKADAFSNQRRRWLSAQLYYFRKDIGPAIWHLLRYGQIDYFDKAIQFIQPPRVLLLGGVLACTLLFGLTNLLIQIENAYIWAWMALSVCCISALLLSVPAAHWNKKTGKALLSLPKGMLLMLGSLLRIKGANKRFIHTKHTSNLS